MTDTDRIPGDGDDLIARLEKATGPDRVHRRARRTFNSLHGSRWTGSNPRHRPLHRRPQGQEPATSNTNTPRRRDFKAEIDEQGCKPSHGCHPHFCICALAEDAADEISRLRAINADMLAELGPMRIALQKQVDLLRFQARNSTAGLARTLIETANGWQALCDNAEAAIAKARGGNQ